MRCVAVLNSGSFCSSVADLLGENTPMNVELRSSIGLDLKYSALSFESTPLSEDRLLFFDISSSDWKGRATPQSYPVERGMSVMVVDSPDYRLRAPFVTRCVSH